MIWSKKFYKIMLIITAILILAGCTEPELKLQEFEDNKVPVADYNEQVFLCPICGADDCECYLEYCMKCANLHDDCDCEFEGVKEMSERTLRCTVCARDTLHVYVRTEMASPCAGTARDIYKCTRIRSGSECGNTTVIGYYTAGHIPGPAATCLQPQRCINFGQVGCTMQYAAQLGHIYGPAETCTTPQICTRTTNGCGNRIIKDALGHSYVGEGEITIEPIGENPGNVIRSCMRNCGTQENRNLWNVLFKTTTTHNGEEFAFSRFGGGAFAQVVLQGENAVLPIMNDLSDCGRRIWSKDGNSGWSSNGTNIISARTIVPSELNDSNIRRHEVVFDITNKINPLHSGIHSGGGELNQQVEHTKKAMLPTVDRPLGYKFVRWGIDNQHQNILAPATINAVYEVLQFKVIFKDWNEGIIHEEKVNFDEEVKSVPVNPVRYGHNFIKWSTNNYKITEEADIVVYAQYTPKQFNVIFLDWDGTELKNERVDFGKAATPPSIPERPDYIFTGWSTQNFTITREDDMYVTARYRRNIDSVMLTRTNVTISARESAFAHVPIQIIGVDDLNPNDNKYIKSARLIGDTGNFDVRVINDGLVEIIPTEKLLNNSNNLKSLRTKLEVELHGNDDKYITTNDLILRMVRTVPRFRFAAIRFNRFFPNDPIALNINTTMGRVTNIRLSESGNTQNNNMVRLDAENRTLALVPNERPRRLAFDIEVDGFGWINNQNVNVSARNLRPAASLSMSTITMKKEAVLRVNSSRTIYDIRIVSNDMYSIQLLNDEPNGTFRLTYSGSGDVDTNTRLRLEVSFEDTENKALLNLSVSKAPELKTVRLSRNNVTLSNKINGTRDNRAVINIIPAPKDADMSESKWVYLENAESHITINWDKGSRAAEIKLKDNAQEGAYGVEFRDRNDRLVATLIVKVVGEEPRITLSQRGRLNIINPESTVRLTPRFINYNWNNGDKVIKIGKGKDVFEIVETTSAGAVTLRMKDVKNKTTERQDVTLIYDGNETQQITITPRKLRPRMQFARAVTLEKDDIYSEGIIFFWKNISTSRIERIEINNELHKEQFSIRRRTDGHFAIGFKTDESGNINPRIRNRENVRLDIYLTGSDRPIRLTVRVLVINNN